MNIFEVMMPNMATQVFDFPADGFETLNFLKDCLPSSIKRELLIYSLDCFRLSAPEPIRSSILAVASKHANGCQHENGVVLLPADLIVAFSARPEVEAAVGGKNLSWTSLVAVTGPPSAINVFTHYWLDTVASELTSQLLQALNESNRYASHA
jgi:hypothetical protein